MTKWTINATAECALLHKSPDRVDTCGTTYIFTATREDNTGSCFPSTLSVTAVLALDDVSIECSLLISGQEDPISGNGTLHIIG